MEEDPFQQTRPKFSFLEKTIFEKKNVNSGSSIIINKFNSNGFKFSERSLANDWRVDADNQFPSETKNALIQTTSDHASLALPEKNVSLIAQKCDVKQGGFKTILRKRTLSERLSWTLPQPSKILKESHPFEENKPPFEQTEVRVIQQTQVHNKVIETESPEHEVEELKKFSSEVPVDSSSTQPINSSSHFTISNSISRMQSKQPLISSSSLSRTEGTRPVASTIIHQEEIREFERNTSSAHDFFINSVMQQESRMEQLNKQLMEVSELLKDFSTEMYLLNNEVLSLNRPVISMEFAKLERELKMSEK